MNVAVDTNLLVRWVVRDDPAQWASVERLFRESAVVAVANSGLCELFWVLKQCYGYIAADIASAIRCIVTMPRVRVAADAVDAGLALLDANGDFSDGVIAFEGRALGGEVFVSFDRRAVNRLTAMGLAARSP